METLLERLRRGEIVVGDGGWGTQLMQRGLGAGECPEAFHLERPEVLTAIAVEYLEAGAEFLTTNTFGGSPLKLRRYGRHEQAAEINRRAVELLRGAAGTRAWVNASVGPSGGILEPYGELSEADAHDSFETQVRALAAAGADLICVETMTDLREATIAVRAAREVAPELPLIATMTFEATPRGFFTIMGTSVERAAEGLAEAGADVVGSNCGNGSETMVRIAREFRQRSALPICIQCNAGLPVQRGGQVVYPETPEFLAEQARELIDLGVAVIGGCCGTTAAHIRALRAAVDAARGVG